MDMSYDQPQYLIATVAKACRSESGFGTISPSVYDTAWLSMIQKPPRSGSWLFPKCFEYVLEHQLPSGGWKSYGTVADGILNTCAALLALRKHMALCPGNEGWTQRSQRAEAALKDMLQEWDLSPSDQIGLELLIPKLLSLLASEGVTIELQRVAQLQALYEYKIKKLSLEDIYGAPSTLLHHLEAFTGYLDFDRIRDRRERNGSMMSSPSSTAAYLIHATTWDEEAESYLRSALERSSNIGSSSVPCAWPTSIFEVSWSVTTLAQAGIPIGKDDSLTLRTFLEEALKSRNGCVGFSQFSTPDSDDTSKAIMALICLGGGPSVRSLIQTFESENHFMTYAGESNLSISSNCNILACLCMLEDRLSYVAQISKAAKFLCFQVTAGKARDKLHRHELYWMMLLVQGFGYLYRSPHDGLLEKVFEKEPSLEEQIPMVSFYVLSVLLSSQQSDGSWDGICEATAYSVLALASLVRLPWIGQELHEIGIIPSIERGKAFLASASRRERTKPEFLWIGKVTYTSEILSQVYYQASMFITPTYEKEYNLSRSLSPLPEETLRRMRQARDLITRTPLLAQLDKGILKAAELQACYALGQLDRLELDIFPRNSMRKNMHLTFVPLPWMACNSLSGGKASFYVLHEMIVGTVLVYEADEYFEATVEKYLGNHLDQVEMLIRSLCDEVRPPVPGNRQSDDTHDTTSKPSFLARKHDDGISEDTLAYLQDVEVVLRKFIAYMLQHPVVLSKPLHLQSRLATELQTFLLANITQAKDNVNLRRKLAHMDDKRSLEADSHGDAILPSQRYSVAPERSFYNWVRGTSADHASCPFAFVFFNCLIDSNLFAYARTAYIAEDLCRHLASLCRMHNDYGGVARDREEGNLNSTHFPIFHRHRDSDGEDSTGLGVYSEAEQQRLIKSKLLWIAEYERRGLNAALSELENELGDSDNGRRLIDAVKLFIDVIDLYGQVYMIRDMTPRNK
ncbi:Ent-kaurene synthase [Daldinia loculata]|nr:Ent-kaurene synthase [Daldinia loculata]